MSNTGKESMVAEKATDMDIRQVLHRDHVKVDELFFQFAKAEDDSEKKSLVDQIILELTLHAKAEEEVVYPEIRDGEEEVESMMDEADTEHHVVKFLLAELGGMKPSDDHFDSKVTVLCELVKHHVEEEEKEMFEKLKDLDNLAEMAEKFLERKSSLAAKPLPEDSFPVIGTRHERKSA
ncbi:MAG: hemerythrin domain-containing protein [Cyanobacteria bacterium SZAS-4]|nr:hemerythrin domain-containing protein [Cyanobacteria bacterium SZAS-4]